MKRFFVLFFTLWSIASSAQQVLGQISDESGLGLAGASIHWLDTQIGSIADGDGIFHIPSEGITDRRLVASYVGYQADTIEIGSENYVDILLKESTLTQVTVTEERGGMQLSVNPIKTEIVGQVALEKSACCDLAGCFENQVTVQPNTTNIVTNSKELRILGLSGVYNQVLIDGFPLIQGLSYTYGISSYPGTFVDKIYVAKGSNSVLQGYESISGQINVIPKNPAQTDRLLVNVFLNQFLEKQLNVNYAFKQKNWSNLSTFHVTNPARKVDRDEDTFLDVPKISRYAISNSTQIGNHTENGWSTKINVRFLNENRQGGQVDFDPKTDKGSTDVYGQTVKMNHVELSNKTTWKLNNTHQIALFNSAFFQKQDAYFGSLNYDADQLNVYSKIQHEFTYSEKGNLKSGLSYRHQNLNEVIQFTDTFLDRNYDGDYQKLENIPGVFAENSINLFNDKITWITGFRADYLDKVRLSPRTLLKYDLMPKTSLRASFGTGWRTANIFSENINLLASSRDVIFLEELNPEQAMNYGINLTQKFDVPYFSGHFSTDFYRTEFQNQIFPDYDSEAGKAFISNYTGKSLSHGFQAEFFAKIWERFDFKTGYQYLDVYRMQNDQKTQLPFNSKHKVIAGLGYKPKTDQFHIDLNWHWYGKKLLPTDLGLSQAYSVLSGQFTYNFPNFEVYAGCENILDFRQTQAITSWENPFDPSFDTASVWGPTKGREAYIGFRYYIRKKE